MSLHLPPRAFRDSYRWLGESPLPYRADGRLHPSRAPYEFYPTPPAATRALLSVESFDGSVWEPACGRGHISKVLEAAEGHPQPHIAAILAALRVSHVIAFDPQVGPHLIGLDSLARDITDVLVEDLHGRHACALEQ